MRTLFAGALAATVVGCSCYVSPQAGLDTCVGGSALACLDRSSVNQTIEPEPAASDTNRSARKARSRSGTRREQPVSAHARHEADLAKNVATYVPNGRVEAMLNCDMRMFSGRENSRRHPPVAIGVDAFA